ncbi:MAG: hypothetical protein K8R99_13945 [Actinomycetia bacterium]|nr:hypothetical protein [Actinomycetes bacterium]
MTRNKIVSKASVLAAAVVTGVVLFAGAAMAAGGDGGPIGPGPRGFGDRDGHHRGGGIVILVAAILLAVLITWLIARRRPAVAQSASAETILSERLARSEISVDDYRTTLAALREASSR